MTLPPKRSKANLNSTCIWGYQSKAGAASRGGGGTHFNPNSSLIIRTMFSPSFFLFFFSPQLGPVLSTSQPQQRRMNTNELWQKKSQCKTYLHFLNFVGLKLTNQWFRSAKFLQLDRVVGCVKCSRWGRDVSGESQLWCLALHLNNGLCYFVTWPSSLKWKSFP